MRTMKENSSDRPSDRISATMGHGSPPLTRKGEAVPAAARPVKQRAAPVAVRAGRQAIHLRRTRGRGNFRGFVRGARPAHRLSFHVRPRMGGGFAGAARSGPTTTTASFRISTSATCRSRFRALRFQSCRTWLCSAERVFAKVAPVNLGRSTVDAMASQQIKMRAPRLALTRRLVGFGCFVSACDAYQLAHYCFSRSPSSRCDSTLKLRLLAQVPRGASTAEYSIRRLQLAAQLSAALQLVDLAERVGFEPTNTR
jgi:hypothetical protein